MLGCAAAHVLGDPGQARGPFLGLSFSRCDRELRDGQVSGVTDRQLGPAVRPWENHPASLSKGQGTQQQSGQLGDWRGRAVIVTGVTHIGVTQG
jgi:hypothetical protein